MSITVFYCHYCCFSLSETIIWFSSLFCKHNLFPCFSCSPWLFPNENYGFFFKYRHSVIIIIWNGTTLLGFCFIPFHWSAIPVVKVSWRKWECKICAPGNDTCTILWLSWMLQPKDAQLHLSSAFHLPVQSQSSWHGSILQLKLSAWCGFQSHTNLP